MEGEIIMQLLKIKESNCTDLIKYLIRVSNELEKEIQRYSVNHWEEKAECIRSARLSINSAIGELKRVKFQTEIILEVK